MPKFLDDIKFIDSQGDEHNVSEYNNQIRTQGGYYTGDSHLERFDGEVPTMTIPQGEISKQGRYFTGLNANDDSVITKKNKEITEFDSSFKYRYGDVVSVTSNETTNYYKCIKGIPEDESIEISNTEYWKKIDRDDAFYYSWNYNIEEAKEGEIYKQGRYWVDHVAEVAQTDSIWGAIEGLQQYNNEFNLENGTGDVLIQTKDLNHSFKAMIDGRVKVYGEPIESDDALRLSEFPVLTQEKVDLLF